MHDRVAISVESVAKVFRSRGRGATVALADVSLEVSEGEFVVLLGASGCGKTTLLRTLAGLEMPSRGVVRLFGDEIKGPSSRAAMVFQSPVLLPWRTVLENVRLPIEIRREKKDGVAEERALALLESTGLGDFAHHYPRELSGGMRQRVAICRALVLDPPILYMDEPFGALDAITRAAMNRDLWNTWRETRKTIVFVTHDITEAVRLGSRVVVMTPRPGRVGRVRTIEIDSDSYEERIDSPQFLEHLRELQRDVGLSMTAAETVDEDSAGRAWGGESFPDVIVGA
jgi:NitT/TauT family transport system ATP-binding protein